MSKAEKAKKKFELPSAIVIVYIFLLVVALMTWFVPTSVVVTGDDGVGQVIYNATFDYDGNVVENAGTNPAGLWDVVLAPIRGFEDASDVGFTIFITGAFLAILNYVGAMDAGIGALLKRFSGRALIIILTLVFALMGTVYGSWEELTAYAIVIIPLFVKAGYDVMTGISVIFVGATIGNMASIINPYSTGAAVAAIGNPDLSMGSGIALRLVLFVVMLGFGLFLLLRYAEGVRKNPGKSIVADLDNINTMVHEGGDTLPELTAPRAWSLAIFGIIVLIIVIGYVPWFSMPVGDQTMYEIINAPLVALSNVPFIGHLFGAGNITWFGDWYFDEFSVVFLIGSVVVAVVNKMSEKEFIEQFLSGCRDLVGVVMVLSVARGISLLMGTKFCGMSVTFVYWMQNLLNGVPLWAFAIMAVIIYTLIGIFLQSTSGVAGITMPIFGAVATAVFAGTAAGPVAGQIILISAMPFGLNFISVIYPGAVNMGIIDMANVPYDRYLKLILRFIAPVLILGTVVLTVAPYIGLI